MVSKDKLNKINEMSDEQLKKSLEDVALSAGFNTKAIADMLSDMGSIRKAVSSVSQSDIDSIINNMSEENASKITEILTNGVQGE